MQTNFTQADAAKEMRAGAKALGLTFAYVGANVHKQAIYGFYRRGKPEQALYFGIFWNCYSDFLSGYIADISKN